MKVFGLSGKSGTGKSYRALHVCKEKNIDYIIDDGLLISGNAILAGRSAKRESTMVGAIKTALFSKEEHKNQVYEAIRAKEPRAILILGTSDEMIHKIAKRLELPEVSEMIYIDDITTEKERDIARVQRMELGKHVIPVATFQLKRQFSGYFLNPLRLFGHKKGVIKDDEDRSIVRPTYSYLGEYFISEKVIADIIFKVSRGVEGVSAVSKIAVNTYDDGIRISADIHMAYGSKVVDQARRLQREIEKQVEFMTAFNVLEIELAVRGLV